MVKVTRRSTIDFDAQDEADECKWRTHPNPSTKCRTLNAFVTESQHIWRLIKIKCVNNWKASMEAAYRPRNSGRHKAHIIVTHPAFEIFITICIAINCVLLAMYDPLDENETSFRNQVLLWGDGILLFIFICEICLKVTRPNPPAIEALPRTGSLMHRCLHLDYFGNAMVSSAAISTASISWWW